MQCRNSGGELPPPGPPKKVYAEAPPLMSDPPRAGKEGSIVSARPKQGGLSRPMRLKFRVASQAKGS